MRKVLVALPEDVVTLMDKELKGKLGEGYSDIIRTITLSWLSEKGYLSKTVPPETIEERRQKLLRKIEELKGGKDGKE